MAEELYLRKIVKEMNEGFKHCMFQKLIIVLLITACSTVKKQKNQLLQFLLSQKISRGELILGTQLLTKIFDGKWRHLPAFRTTMRPHSF